MKESELLRPLKKIDLQLKTQSWPMPYANVMNCYEKESYTCIVILKDEKIIVHKYPTSDVFRIVEEY